MKINASPLFSEPNIIFQFSPSLILIFRVVLICIRFGQNIILGYAFFDLPPPLTTNGSGQYFDHVSVSAKGKIHAGVAGNDCLNLKFPIGLHVILQIQIRKFENDCYIM